MRKTKKRITEVAEAYVHELKGRFPGIQVEILDERIGGHDVWIRVGMPTEEDDLFMRILEATGEMNVRYDEETGVHIVATPFLLEHASA